MRAKFKEWTQIHADMYWDRLQNCEHVLNIGSGYGFLEEAFNSREGKKFSIEGDDIGRFRLENYVGGICHNINFMTDEIPSEMVGKYDLVMGLHILEHINSPVEYLSRLKPLFKKKENGAGGYGHMNGIGHGHLIIEVPNLNSFLCELSPEYAEFFYLYEHVSYFTVKTLADTVTRAGYTVDNVYSKELYSVENHINWVRTGKPFIKYNQMFLPDERIEFINREYKEAVGKMGKGFALIVEAHV